MKSSEESKRYTAEEMAELEKSRTLSDAELLKGGAEYRVNKKGEKNLELSKLQIIAAENMKDKEAVIALIKRNNFMFEYVPSEFKDDKDVVLLAVKQNGYNLRHASARLKDDKDVVLAAVKKDGLALEYVSGELKTHRDIVLEAIMNYRRAFIFADPMLQKDPEIRKAAGVDNW